MLCFVKKVIRAKMEKTKTVSYWLAKCFRLGVFYVFKDEFKNLFDWIVANVNISIADIFRTFAVAGFVLSFLIAFAILADMALKKESLETFPDKVESIFHKLDSLLEEKIASL